MFKHKYQRLDTSDEEPIPLPVYEKDDCSLASSGRTFGWLRASVVLLATSLIMNALQFFQPSIVYRRSEVLESSYAKLPRNMASTFHRSQRHTSQNRTIADAAWAEIDINDGYIALPDSFTQSHDLPDSQRFPWDDDKGIYIASSYHSLHCLRKLRTAVFETHDGLPQSIHFSHLIHCLDMLRQDTLCSADETPLWTGMGADNIPGNGQTRMCRDWTKLQAWLQQYNACFSSDGIDDPNYPEINHFYNCPPDSPYLAISQKNTEEFNSD